MLAGWKTMCEDIHDEAFYSYTCVFQLTIKIHAANLLISTGL